MQDSMRQKFPNLCCLPFVGAELYLGCFGRVKMSLRAVARPVLKISRAESCR